MSDFKAGIKTVEQWMIRIEVEIIEDVFLADLDEECSTDLPEVVSWTKEEVSDVDLAFVEVCRL